MRTVVSCSSPRCSNDHDMRQPALCPDCVRRVDRNLRRLPELYRELEYSLNGGRTAGRAGGNVGGRGVSAGIPLNGRAVEARTTVRDVLACWVRLVVEELRVQAPPVEVAALAAFLRDRLDWLRTHPACGDLAEEITELVTTAANAAQPVGARSIQVGDCVHDDCRGRLVAVVRPGERALPAAVRCTADSEHTWSTRQWTVLSHQLRRTA